MVAVVVVVGVVVVSFVVFVVVVVVVVVFVSVVSSYKNIYIYIYIYTNIYIYIYMYITSCAHVQEGVYPINALTHTLIELEPPAVSAGLPSGLVVLLLRPDDLVPLK